MFATAMTQLDRFGATATRYNDSGMGSPNDISVSMGVFAPPVIQAVKDVQDHSILVTFGARSDLHVIMVAKERCIMAGVTRKGGWKSSQSRREERVLKGTAALARNEPCPLCWQCGGMDDSNCCGALLHLHRSVLNDFEKYRGMRILGTLKMSHEMAAFVENGCCSNGFLNGLWKMDNCSACSAWLTAHTYAHYDENRASPRIREMLAE